MSISPTKFGHPPAVDIETSDDALTVHLADGRTISVPLTWYPRLANGSPAERARWELLGSGQGIHWPDLDEDISVEALLNGQRSNEAPASLKTWLSKRQRDR